MTVREGWATADDGVRLAYRLVGEGPGLVLSHGGPGLADDLAPLPVRLAETAGVTVVSWDQRGVGASDPVGPHTLARYDADLVALRRHLGWDAWFVGGHSFGAMLALHHVLAHPGTSRGLVHLSGVGTGRAWHAAAETAAGARLTEEQRERRDHLAARERTAAEEVAWRALAWLPDFVGDEAMARATALAEGSGPICWEANRSPQAEAGALDEAVVLDRCRTVAVPAVVVHGAEDPRPAWAVDDLVAALAGTLVVVPGAGHRPWVEALEPVVDAVRSLVRGVVAPST